MVSKLIRRMGLLAFFLYLHHQGLAKSGFRYISQKLHFTNVKLEDNTCEI